MIRIANGQGFWGDWLEAPVRLIDQGPIDYLALDYLAEITMSILQKQKQADPELGYARDFPPLIARIAKPLRDRNVKVIANAGGVNPTACAHAVLKSAPGLKVAVVLGDDVFDRIQEFRAKGYDLCENILSANAYIGAFPLAEALATGADVVVAGRSTDTALALAPMVHRFHWSDTDYDKLAAGTIAGHIIECGAQCTGGNCQVDWQAIPDMANIGYPIVEAEPDGSFTVTKHSRAGGRVHSDVIKEQLLYELGDPKNYITPDCTADFTTIRLEDTGPDRVRVSGIRGGPRPPTLKLSISYFAGWKATGTLVYTWPQPLEKAQAADEIVRQRLAALGLTFDEIYTEFFGARSAEPMEIQLRIGVRSMDKAAVDRFTREMIPLVLNGPPGATGFGDGRPPVREIVAYSSALIPREEIQTRVEVFE